MIAAIKLGVRLAIRTSREGRVRAGMVALAAGVGTLVIMSVRAVAAADRVASPDRYADGGMSRVVALIVVVIGIQVAGLAGVAGRLAAAMRSRRLSNLRLLGLSARRTRVVAAIEVAVSATAGAIVALLVFPVVRIALANVEIASQSWSTETLTPSPLDWVAVPAGVVGMVAAVAALPERFHMRAALGQARRADARPPSPLRLVPLVVGIALSAYVQIERRGDQSAARWMFAAIALLALGTVLVLPIFVRLAAALLLRFSNRSTTLIAARRLQAQPAAMTRVVTGLLLALFVVVGARNVVAAWEATPQYVAAERQVHHEQRFGVVLPPGRPDDVIAQIESFPGVRQVAAYHRLEERCVGTEACGDTAVVADCSTFELIVPTATGCRDGAVMQIGLHRQGATGERTWVPRTTTGVAAGPTIITLEPTGAIDLGDAPSVPGGLLIPPSYPALATTIDHTDTEAVVLGDPGPDLADQLHEAGIIQDSYRNWSRADYDFVVMLRAIVYTIAAIVIGIGLLGFAIAAIDRAGSRRRELVSLQLIGVSATTLRRTQWIESLIPISSGALLAVILGQLAGATFLAFGDEPDAPTTVPWEPAGIIALIAIIGGVIVAALTVIATDHPINPNNIRSE